jgi:hypothetical protein
MSVIPIKYVYTNIVIQNSIIESQELHPTPVLCNQFKEQKLHQNSMVFFINLGSFWNFIQNKIGIIDS